MMCQPGIPPPWTIYKKLSVWSNQSTLTTSFKGIRWSHLLDLSLLISHYPCLYIHVSLFPTLVQHKHPENPSQDQEMSRCNQYQTRMEQGGYENVDPNLLLMPKEIMKSPVQQSAKQIMKSPYKRSGNDEDGKLSSSELSTPLGYYNLSTPKTNKKRSRKDLKLPGNMELFWELSPIHTPD